MKTKTVIVLRSDLAPGVAANTAAVLAISLGAARPELVGPTIPDAAGGLHRGLTGVPLPILAADAAGLADLAAVADPGVEVIDFTMTAARARDYAGYTAALAATAPAELEYLGVALVGPVKAVTRLTGGLPLYR